MYKLAVVPKIPRRLEYSSAYGSNYDYKHTKKCLTSATMNRDIKFNIIYDKKFYRRYTHYDGVIFVGLKLKSNTFNFLSRNDSMDIFIWSFNQINWVCRSEMFDKVNIVFEQSTRNILNHAVPSTQIYYFPLGFQSDRNITNKSFNRSDIVFNGTLYRNRREHAKNYRKDLLKLLLQNGLSIINYNGRSKSRAEKELLSGLLKFNNFKLKNFFGNVDDYHHGIFSLDLPFLETGTESDRDQRMGMSWHELENTVWLLHWDIFRSIGAKSNIITFDSPKIRDLGLSENNCHFYKSDTTDLNGMAEEIVKIVRTGVVKSIPDDVWQKNTYQARWDFIIDKICKKVGL